MIQQILTYDQALFSFLNALHCAALDPFFFIVSKIWPWIPMYLFLLFLLIRKYRKRALLYIAMLIVIITCTDQSCNLIKRSAQRLRPSHEPALANTVHLHAYEDGTYYYGGKYGFPSAHAANSMALSLFFIFFLTKKRKIYSSLLIVWCLLLSYSRIYLGVHYPVDIICGWITGCCYATMGYFLIQYLEKNFFSRYETSN